MNFDEFVDSGMYDELCHYGIPGMKWGVRRTPEELGHRKVSSNRKKDSSIKKDRKKARKNRRILSDADLESRIKRLEKEKRLKDLTDDDVSAGQKFAKEVLKKVGTTAVVGATAYGLHTVIRNSPEVKAMMREIYTSKGSATISAVKKTGKKIASDVNWKDLANYMAPNPKKK